MSIWTIADLHLSFCVDKPMNIFGENWDNYEDKVQPIINKMNKGLLNDVAIAGGFTVGLIGIVILNFVLRSKLLKNN